MSKGLYFTHPACLEHDPRTCAPWHPDAPERLSAIEATLGGCEWLGFERRACPAASVAELQLAHESRHVTAIRELCDAGGGALDPDTFASAGSYQAALYAAGGACAMTRALLGGESQLGFCAARPPGHHAESGRAMGFCLFNNIAIAAALATSELGLQRVMIIDWDVHHGNGTAELFRTRADVLFSSIHQYGIFPGSGALSDVGSAAGEGYTINLPVPAGSQGDLWCALIAHVLVPSALAFQPQLILVSAGFDAHLADPLAGCELREDSFALMAALVGDLARTLQVPLGLVLEGGYEPRALAASVRATLAALGDQASAPQVQRAPLAQAMAAEIGRHWPL